MSRVAVLCVLLVVVALTLGDDKYTDKYDNINVEDILKSDRQLNFYQKCLLEDESKCTEDGKFFKSILTEVLSTDCAKCTDKQRSDSEKTAKFLKAYKPDVWKAVLAKFDPEGNFLKKHPEYAS